MKRILWPLLFFAATAWMYQHNAADSGSVMVLPMVDVLFPDVAGDNQAMGQASVKMMGGISALMLVYEIFLGIRDFQRNKAQPEEDE